MSEMGLAALGVRGTGEASSGWVAPTGPSSRDAPATYRCASSQSTIILEARSGSWRIGLWYQPSTTWSSISGDASDQLRPGSLPHRASLRGLAARDQERRDLDPLGPRASVVIDHAE